MIAAVLATSVLQIHIATTPPAKGQAVVEALCAGGARHTVTAALASDVKLPFPCRPVSILVTAPGFLDQNVPVPADASALSIALVRPAMLLMRAGERSPQTVVWLPVRAASPSRFTVTPETERLPLAPGEGCMVLLRKGSAPKVRPLRLDPGATVAVGDEPWSKGIMIEGSVVNQDRIPVEADLEVVREVPAEKGKVEADGCASALADLGITRGHADAAGSFLLGPLPPGRTAVEVRANGYARAELVRVLPNDATTVRLEPVVLRAVAALLVEIDASLTGERPPFELVLERERETYFKKSDRWEQQRTVKIDQEPSVTLKDLRPGFYRVILSKAGSDLSFAQLVDVSQGSVQTLRLRPEPISLVGTVTQDRKPVEGAQVRLVHDGLEHKAVSDYDGSYRMRIWTPADYLVVTFREGDSASYPSHVDLTTAKTGEEVRHDIELPGSAIEGVVVDRQTQKPLESAMVRLQERRLEQDMQSQRSVATDRTGRFTFPYVTPDAITTIEVSAEKHLPASFQVDPRSEGSRRLVIQLESGSEISGRVVGPGAEPVAGATVGCCPPTVLGDLGVAASTGPDGSFRLTVVEGATIWAVAQDYALGWAVAQEGDVVIHLQPKAKPLDLILLDHLKDPVAGMQVTFATNSGALVPARVLEMHAFLSGGRSLSDKGGRLRVTALPPGTYQTWLITPIGLTPLGLVQSPSPADVILLVPEAKKQ